MSLTLDMCTPGCTEPYGYGAQLSPRDQSAQEYLRQGTHVLTHAMLHTRAMEDQSLQAEFYVSVDPRLVGGGATNMFQTQTSTTIN